MELFLQTVISELTKIGFKIVYAALILIIGLNLVKLIIKWIKKSKGFSKIAVNAQSFILSIIKISLNILIVISAAIVLGLPMTSFVTLLASAGVALGLAWQGSLSNFAGGLMIIIFKPFKIGDYIKTESFEGTVRDISVFYTTLVTIDNKTVTLPNGTLTNNAVTNYSSEPLRRVDITFSAAYSSDIQTVKKLLLECAKKNKYTVDEPEATAYLVKHNDSSLDFQLRTWCITENYWDAYYSLNEDVKTEFDNNKIEIPFPQMDIHLDK